MSTSPIYNEPLLLQQLRGGSAEAFTQLYYAYSGQMYSNIFRLVKDKQITEEIVQEIFTRIWQKRDALIFNTDFSAYLYRMGQNLVIDFYRKLQRDRELLENFKARATEYYEPIEENLYFSESNTRVHLAMDTLSPQQKKVFQLCKLDGYSYHQAALELDISPFTVKEYLSLASKVVRSYLNNSINVG